MSTNGHRGMGRRQFLIASSTCALAAAVGPNIFAAGTAAPKRLAVGFVPLDDGAAAMPAAAIRSGDGAFLDRGARVFVSGAAGTTVDPRSRRGVDLLAHYAISDGGEVRTVPFRAWSCNRVTGCDGSPTSFTVPLAEQQKLVFTLETERGTPAGAAATRRDLMGGATESTLLPVTLSVRKDTGALQLTRGYYVLVPLFENDSEPNWSSWSVRSVQRGLALHDGAGNRAPFEHFVLQVDYAKA
jgi:hypothetical protein